jgi:hypothetical protein
MISRLDSIVELGYNIDNEVNKSCNSVTPVEKTRILDQWYSTFFVRVPPDIISLQLCTPKVVGT